MRVVLRIQRPILQVPPDVTAYSTLFHKHSSENDDLVAIVIGGNGQGGECHSGLRLLDVFRWECAAGGQHEYQEHPLQPSHDVD
jgi:hypothetical protein